MRPVLPRRLEPGDAVAVVSPSWGGPEAFPHVFDAGVAVLRGWGLDVREMPSTRAPAARLAAEPRLRADDVNAAFADPAIRAIISTIGGDDSIRLLPYLDEPTISSNPKILMGYSDTTTLLAAIRRFGIVTHHGPSVMAGLAQVDGLPPAFREHIRRMLFEPAASHRYVPYGAYAEGYPDWRDPSTAGRVNPSRADDGWHVVQGTGRAHGELFGGCLEVLDWLRGSSAWPIGDEWAGRLLFVETSEEKPPRLVVERILRSFGAQGVFERISGLLVGRARGHTTDEKLGLETTIRDVIATEFGRPDLPIVANLDFGHTDPQWVLPLGVRAELDVDARSLTLVEPWLA
jgi:muramoyltetrapeptide carboxypeptidase LdcA involved in peptidoglycan recycling